MNTLLKSFGLDATELSSFLRISRGAVAGSAALYAYQLQQLIMKQRRWCWRDSDGANGANGVRNDDECRGCVETALLSMHFKPNDIDIWIPIPGYMNDKSDNVVPMLTNIVRAFMASQKYEQTHFSSVALTATSAVEEADEAAYFDTLDSITWLHKILNFKNEAGQTIQVLLTADVPMRIMLESFDLSVCRVVWTPRSEFGDTATDIIKNIDANQALISSNSGVPSERTYRRIEKYKARGFDILAQL